MYVLKNINPSKRSTDDAYIRALCMALNISYKQAYKALADFAMGQCLSMNDIRALRGFLKSFEYREQQLNKKCNLDVFSNTIAKSGKRYIVRYGKAGVTVVVDKNIYDSFNPSKKLVNSYWTIN